MIAIFSFRYKITAVITAILIVLLISTIWITQLNIESEFRKQIDQRLVQTQRYIKQHIEESFERLYTNAIAVSQAKLTLDILYDQRLTQATRNDILNTEIGRDLFNVDMLVVADADGGLKARSGVDELFLTQLLTHDWMQKVLEGNFSAGITLYEQKLVKVMASPVFLNAQMLGIVILGETYTQQDIEQIKEINDVELTLFYEKQKVLSSQWSKSQAFDQWFDQQEDNILSHKGTLEVVLDNSRYLLQVSNHEEYYIPTYILSKSLDDALLFVSDIKTNALLIGLLGFIFSVILSFIFAIGISRPIHRLLLGTKEAERENFAYRVNVQTRDEFSLLAESFNQMMIGLEEKQKIRDVFNKSVSKEVASHMLEKGNELEGETHEATILFTDIRGFTSLSEQLSEKQLLQLLNHYFTNINHCIQSNRGTIDKFIGDSVMALFGVPETYSDHAYHALNSAQSMCAALEKFNREVSSKYACHIEMGIGINTGNIVAGLVGSHDRLNYTVIGDQVNLASRLEGLTKYYGASTIISASTKQAINATQDKKQNIQWIFRRLDCVQVKGKTTGIAIYQPLPSDHDLQLNDCIMYYHQALDDMHTQQFGKAVKGLQALINQWPEDMPSHKLLERCEAYLKDPDHYARDYSKRTRIFTNK